VSNCIVILSLIWYICIVCLLSLAFCDFVSHFAFCVSFSVEIQIARQCKLELKSPQTFSAGWLPSFTFISVSKFTPLYVFPLRLSS
jgi:hypothetical protein